LFKSGKFPLAYLRFIADIDSEERPLMPVKSKAIPASKRKKIYSAVPAVEKLQDFRTTDGKGRVVLGSPFANKHVIIVRKSATEVVVKLARVIPESEAWLYENKAALDMVSSGLKDAKAGKLVNGPDLAIDSDWADDIAATKPK
jgi:hypothetical protein